MADTNLLVVGMGIGAATLTAFATYKIGKRKNSGDIDTSDATVLWTEANAMRQEMRNEIIDLRKQLADARSSIWTLENKVKTLEEKI